MRRRAVLGLLAALAAALLALPAGAWADADTTPPSLSFTGALYAQPITNASAPAAEFTVSDTSGLSSVQCKVDSGSFADCASPYSMPGLDEGRHTVTVRAVDASPLQNSNTQSFDFVVDRTAPTLDLPATATVTDAVTWGFADANGPVTSTCKLDDVATACANSSFAVGALTGTHVLEVTVTDAAGNFTTKSETFTVDSSAPTVDITGGPVQGAVTSDTTPTFDFTDSDDVGVTSRQCAIDTEALADCTSPFTAAPLSDGPHVLEVQVSDGTHFTTAFASFVVDTTQPTITFLVADGSYVNGAIGFEAFDASTPSLAFQCDVGDGSGFQPCGTTIDLSALGNGPHTIAVRTADAAGNTASKSISIVIDRDTPTITPGQITVGTGTATVTFTAADSTSPVTTSCRLDGGPYGACTTPGSDTVSGVAPGSHSIDVLVVDAAGNRNIFTATFTVPTPQSSGGTAGGGGGGTPAGAADTTPPKLFAKLHRHGHRAPTLTLRCSERCSVKLRFTRKGKTLGTRTVKLAANRSATTTLTLSRGFGHARSLKVLLRITATDSAGNHSSRTLSVTLYRR
ncbi:MAG TPA: Ig-like domain-containing protein [Solirubrobacteraceae bacterium]|nr:Ig-like domain-containing protein [Solirubrobacteraceae bacterium]